MLFEVGSDSVPFSKLKSSTFRPSSLTIILSPSGSISGNERQEDIALVWPAPYALERGEGFINLLFQEFSFDIISACQRSLHFLIC